MILTEKEAEAFLEKEKFDIVKRVFVKDVKSLKGAIKKISFPLVMKVSGKKIVHKNSVGGVVDDVNNYEEASKIFRRLRKIKGCEEILIQKQLEGREFLLGIKKTLEFGHTVAFGAGGINTEKLNDVSFRVCDFNKVEASKMINEIEASKDLKKQEREVIVKNIIKLCDLSKNYKGIKELDINPLFVKDKKAVIADARIVFED